MEHKLEKICKVSHLKEGLRYNLSKFGNPSFCFVVTTIEPSAFIYVKYLDGTIGCFRQDADVIIWEQPFSSLELELL